MVGVCLIAHAQPHQDNINISFVIVQSRDRQIGFQVRLTAFYRLITSLESY